MLPFCISFSCGWSWSLTPVQYHEPLSIVLQALCLSDLITWICLLLPLYKGFNLGHTVVLEKTFESPLDCKEIQPVHSKGDQSWVFFGRTDAKAETPILWPPHVNIWLIGKDSDAGRDWGQEEKGTTEDEMAGWHHQLDGHEFEWTRELVMDREACMLQFMGSQRVGHDWATELNWTELNWMV